MLNAIALLVYFVLSAFGLYMLKNSPEPLSVNFSVGFASYALGFLIWLYLLARLPLSVVFPVAAGGLIVCTQFVGFFLLGEKIGPYHVAGILLVITGITLIYFRA